MIERKNISFEEAVLDTTLLPFFINLAQLSKKTGCYQHPGRLRVLPILSHKKVTTTSNFLCAHFSIEWRKFKCLFMSVNTMERNSGDSAAIILILTGTVFRNNPNGLI